jgi:hypothetical protein
MSPELGVPWHQVRWLLSEAGGGQSWGMTGEAQNPAILPKQPHCGVLFIHSLMP